MLRFLETTKRREIENASPKSIEGSKKPHRRHNVSVRIGGLRGKGKRTRTYQLKERWYNYINYKQNEFKE